MQDRSETREGRGDTRNYVIELFEDRRDARNEKI